MCVTTPVCINIGGVASVSSCCLLRINWSPFLETSADAVSSDSIALYPLLHRQLRSNSVEQLSRAGVMYKISLNGEGLRSSDQKNKTMAMMTGTIQYMRSNPLPVSLSHSNNLSVGRTQKQPDVSSFSPSGEPRDPKDFQTKPQLLKCTSHPTCNSWALRDSAPGGARKSITQPTRTW